ncbi:hypothetical protein [Fictibacillus terranigra]|uniref:Response regulatory domain-containing protein n=1 Tax=Fictibacillus terranigra TaxID=3058424 RepID=A0ABT8E4V1_9BACL|nr:hypothetical protein [Fictibacillus sp. CENA-BCM004]MDN4072933.1 hypothetical protein [Fictibacillus sp. CENA-BCM004]
MKVLIAEDDASSRKLLKLFIDSLWFLGWHWCADLENKARGWGIKDPYDEPYADFVDPVKDYNKGVYQKIENRVKL